MLGTIDLDPASSNPAKRLMAVRGFTRYLSAIDPRTEDIYTIIDGKTSETPSTITISADGMTMTQVVHGKNSKGKAFTNRVVYDKQL